MNHLQEILDAKWPISNKHLHPTTIKGRERCRKIFTEGYNAAMESAKEMAFSAWVARKEHHYPTFNAYWEKTKILYGEAIK